MKRTLIFFSGLAFLVMAIRFSVGMEHAVPAWQLACLWIVGLFYTLKPIATFVYQLRDKTQVRETL